MPTTVLVIGVCSIILLLWAGRINQQLTNDSAIVDAVMDVQIHTATYHLWLEESIAGNVPVTVGEAQAALDQAIYLVNVTLDGGKGENDWVAEPLTDPELRARMIAVKSLLARLKTLGLERYHNADRSGSGSALEHEFHRVFKESVGRLRGVEDSLEIEEAGNIRHYGIISSGVLVCWLAIVIAATAGLWSREREREKAEEELRKANEQLLSQKEELTAHRERLTELVEERTAGLTAANALVRTEMAERLQACEMLTATEQQIDHLSLKLLTAQEIERKRISMELHDELGQALYVTKLRLRFIEKGLRKDQQSIREDCENLLEYMDDIIEEVRRLSLDLSPTVLEDLGLASALRWLSGNLAKYPETEVTSDIAEIDDLVPRDHWITIYRVVQEALTNIGKHARAQNVAVVVRRADNTVVFSVEDDGKGFNPVQALMKNASEKGLGLTTMKERVRLMGGELELWSRAGEGTRVTFGIPIGKGGA